MVSSCRESDDLHRARAAILLFPEGRNRELTFTSRGMAVKLGFWLDPHIELAANHGLSPTRLSLALRLVKEHEEEIRKAWQRHFGR